MFDVLNAASFVANIDANETPLAELDLDGDLSYLLAVSVHNAVGDRLGNSAFDVGKFDCRGIELRAKCRNCRARHALIDRKRGQNQLHFILYCRAEIDSVILHYFIFLSLWF